MIAVALCQYGLIKASCLANFPLIVIGIGQSEFKTVIVRIFGSHIEVVLGGCLIISSDGEAKGQSIVGVVIALSHYLLEVPSGYVMLVVSLLVPDGPQSHDLALLLWIAAADCDFKHFDGLCDPIFGEWFVCLCDEDGLVGMSI